MSEEKTKDITIHLKALDKYDMEVTGPYGLLQYVLKFLTAQYEDIKRFKTPRMHQGEMKTIIKEQKFKFLGSYNNYTNVITCKRGYFYFIVTYLYALKLQYPGKIAYQTDINIKGDLTVIDKWQHQLYKGQLEAIEAALKLKCGLIQLPTAFGKTEIFISVLESYLVKYSHNHVVITVSSNPVKEEIIARLKRYDIKSERVRVINPKGYCRSNDYRRKVDKDWLDKVGLILSDEGHHIKSKSYEKFWNECPNIEYSYAFSATLSTYNLRETIDFEDWDINTKHIIGLTGPCLVYKVGKDYNRQLHYIQARGFFSNTPPDIKGKDHPDKLDFNANLKLECRNPEFKRFIYQTVYKYAYQNNDRIFYMPIPLVAPGFELFDYLNTRGIKVIQWSSGMVRSTDGDVEPNLDSIKNALRTLGYKLMIATSMSNEGIDIEVISGVILAFGRDYKLPIQTAGRARSEGKIPMIINVYSQKNILMMSQARKRDIQLNKNYTLTPEDLNFNI